MRPLIYAIGLTLAVAGPSFAQSSNSTQNPAQNRAQNTQAQNQNQGRQSIRQDVENNLKSAGFTDIKIMPESFLVRAKDKSGNPVMMVINPDSITAVEVSGPNGSSNATTGSAPGNNAPGNRTQNPTGGQH